jgi:hypothetical protein
LTTKYRILASRYIQGTAEPLTGRIPWTTDRGEQGSWDGIYWLQTGGQHFVSLIILEGPPEAKEQQRCWPFPKHVYCTTTDAIIYDLPGGA